MNWNPWCCLSWCVGSPPLGACWYKLASTGEEVASHCCNFPFCAPPLCPHSTFWFVSLYWQYYCSTPLLHRTPPPLPVKAYYTVGLIIWTSVWSASGCLQVIFVVVFILLCRQNLLSVFQLNVQIVNITAVTLFCFLIFVLKNNICQWLRLLWKPTLGIAVDFNERSHIHPFSNLHLLIVSCAVGAQQRPFGDCCSSWNGFNIGFFGGLLILHKLCFLFLWKEW